MIIYGYRYLWLSQFVKKKYCAAIFSYTDRTIRIVALWHRERQLFSKWITFFPHFCLRRGGCFQRDQRIELACGQSRPTEREREIELAHELMTIGFLFLCSLKILAQGGHQVTSRWKPFSEASAFADPEERLRWSCLPLPILAITLCPNFRTVSSLAVGPGTFLQSCQWQLALVFLSFDVSNFHAY